MPSFDAVSELNAHEVANAVDQANRELAQRFDFNDYAASVQVYALKGPPASAGGLSRSAPL